MKYKVAAGSGLALFIAVATAFIAAYSDKSLPDLQLKVIDGSTISTEDLQGVPTLITFWATTCSTCIREMPHLVDLYHELNGDGFEIIAIAMSYDPPNRVVEFTQNRKLPYSIVLDIDGRAARELGNIDVTPTSILVSPKGKIVNRQQGKIDFQTLRQHIKKMQTHTTTAYSKLQGYFYALV